MSDKELVKKSIEKYFSHLNSEQREAVFQIKGAELIIAGAGSGKTSVLVNRSANMILFGDAYHNPPPLNDNGRRVLSSYLSGDNDVSPNSLSYAVNAYFRPHPWEILCVTFTNKAAGELKNRLISSGIAGAEKINAGTFHSLCVRILRKSAHLLNYNPKFTIYDMGDSRNILKASMKALNINKNVQASVIANYISKAKDELKTPKIIELEEINYPFKEYAKVYSEYQRRLRQSEAMDFDDLIMNVVLIFRHFPQELEYWQDKFHFIMADEYQDTNHAQYCFLSLLAKKRGNLCVVGDEDQSIYAFRGADIENIRSFSREFKDAKIIVLEKNYRSTENILEAANAVISNNTHEHLKTLKAVTAVGKKIFVQKCFDNIDEGRFIAEKVSEHIKNGGNFSDCAVLYRMNARSRSIEIALTQSGIPNKIVAGLKFYERREVKDILAYLSLIEQKNDFQRFSRVINIPKRGLGEVTTNNIRVINEELLTNNIESDLIKICSNAGEYQILSRCKGALALFAETIYSIEELAREIKYPQKPSEIVDIIIKKTGYIEALKKELEDDNMPFEERFENINELRRAIDGFFNMKREEEFLDGDSYDYSEYLENIALISSLDVAGDDNNAVLLMTVHSAKGLEFENIFIAGFEDGTFPSGRTAYNSKDLEEERRLAYVAITRAKKQLFISHCSTSNQWGRTEGSMPSRFLKEIPEELIEYPVEKKILQSDPNSHIFVQDQRAPIDLVLQKNNKINFVDLKPGVKITHKIFGEGEIVGCTDLSGDCLLEVNFVKKGLKKIMAKASGIQIN